MNVLLSYFQDIQRTYRVPVFLDSIKGSQVVGCELDSNLQHHKYMICAVVHSAMEDPRLLPRRCTDTPHGTLSSSSYLLL